MPGYDASLARFTRRVSRGDNSSSVRLPRAPQMTMHLGTIAETDPNTNTAHFQFNDPTGLIVPGVRVMQMYGGTTQPEVGHLVWAYHYGTDLMIAGQHITPTNIIIP